MESLVAHFARLVAGRTDRIRLITKDNETDEAPWDPQSFCRPFAVYLGDVTGYKTLALDFDKEDAERHSFEAVHLLKSSGLKVVHTKSGPTGGHHVFVSLTEHVPHKRIIPLAQALSRRFPSLDMTRFGNPNWSCIRPPMAPHRRGGFNEPLMRADDALTLLSDGNSPLALDDLADNLGVRLISPRTLKLLRYGGVDGRYREANGRVDRSRLLQGLALAYVNDEIALSDFIEDCLDPQNIGGEKAQEIRTRHGKGSAIEYLSRTFEKAETFAAENPKILARIDWVARLDESAKAIQGKDASRAAPGRRQVMRVFIETSKRFGPVFDLSVRDGANGAGMTATTFNRHCRYLERVGVISKEKERDDFLKATNWRFHPEAVTHIYTPPYEDMCIAVPGSYEPIHDVWRYKGLGLRKKEIWDFIGTREISSKELAAVLGIKPKTVSEHLRGLEKYGLVERRGKRWVALSPELDDIASELGTAGTFEQQRERDQLDRDLRQQSIQEYRDAYHRDNPRMFTRRVSRRTSIDTAANPERAVRPQVDERQSQS